jgi:uridine kinase
MTNIARQLAGDLERHIQTYGRALLVIDGDCAAGKTTLAARIAGRLDCNVFPMDDFFLPPALRTEARLTEAGGNIDYERFLAQVLKPLRENRPFRYGAYSCQTNASRAVPVTPRPVSIVEGSYALHPRFLEIYRELRAIKVFMRVTPAEQLKRIQSRNGEAMLRRFREEWIPMEKRYRQAYENAWGDVTFIDG